MKHRHTKKIAGPQKDVAYIPGKVPPEPVPVFTPHVIPIAVFRLLLRTEFFDPTIDYRIEDGCFQLIPFEWKGTRHRSGNCIFRVVTTVPLTVNVQ
jgi:hypothetical protein